MSVEYSLECAAQRGNYLPLVAAIERGEATDSSMEAVEAFAEENGHQPLLEEAKRLAFSFNDTRMAMTVAGDRAGLNVIHEWDGGVSVGKGKKDSFSVSVSSPIIIDGVGYTLGHKNPVLYIKVQTETGNWNDLVLARSELTNGGALQAKLKSAGIRSADITTLVTLLSVIEPTKRVLSLEHAGWNGDFFVLPNGEVIGDTGSLQVRAGFPIDEKVDYGKGGSKEGADDLLRSVEGEPQVIVAVGAALCAPFIEGTNIAEPGIYHWSGSTSIGKSTTAYVAASMLGRGCSKRDGGIVQLWNLTPYGLATHVADMLDLPLFLDDTSQIKNSADCKQIIYDLNNGTTKLAGNGYTTALREVKALRSPVISTGEDTMKAITERDGNSAHRGGAELRALDFTFKKLSCDVDKVKAHAKTHYGHHFRGLVEHLVKDRDGVMALIRDRMNTILPEESLNEFARVRQRFALIAAVLEFAIEKGVLPWKAGSGTAAVVAVFEDWKVERGGPDALPFELQKQIQTFEETLFRHKSRVHYLNFSGCLPNNRLCAFKGDRLYFDKQGLAEAVGTDDFRAFLLHLREGKSDDYGLVADGNNLQGKLNGELKAHLGHSRMYIIVDKNRERVAQREREAAESALSDSEAV